MLRALRVGRPHASKWCSLPLKRLAFLSIPRNQSVPVNRRASLFRSLPSESNSRKCRLTHLDTQNGHPRGGLAPGPESHVLPRDLDPGDKRLRPCKSPLRKRQLWCSLHAWSPSCFSRPGRGRCPRLTDRPESTDPSRDLGLSTCRWQLSSGRPPEGLKPNGSAQFVQDNAETLCNDAPFICLSIMCDTVLTMVNCWVRGVSWAMISHPLNFFTGCVHSDRISYREQEFFWFIETLDFHS